jgi:transcriptional regulator with XRE-family HTH domain
MTNFDEKELSPLQLRAVAALAQGESLTAVAEEMNLSRQTLSAWVNQNAAFQTALRQLQAEMFDEAADRVRGLTARSLDVISEGLENPNYRIRLTAATKVLSLNLSALAQQSRPPKTEIPAKLCENCEQEKIDEIMNGFDV